MNVINATEDISNRSKMKEKAQRRRQIKRELPRRQKPSDSSLPSGAGLEVATTESTASLLHPKSQEDDSHVEANTRVSLRKLDDLVKSSSEIASNLLQTTAMAFEGKKRKADSAMAFPRSSVLEACRPIQSRIRHYVQKYVPPQEIHVIELELTELMKRLVTLEKEQVELRDKVARERREKVAMEEGHRAHVRAVDEKWKFEVERVRVNHTRINKDLRRKIMQMELKHMRSIKALSQEKARWEVEEERRREQHRQYLVAETQQRRVALEEAQRQTNLARGRAQEESLKEKVAAETTRVRISLTATMKAQLKQYKEMVEDRAQENLSKLAAPFRAMHEKYQLLANENAELRTTCHDLMELLEEQTKEANAQKEKTQSSLQRMAEHAEKQRSASESEITRLKVEKVTLEERLATMESVVDKHRKDDNIEFWKQRLRRRNKGMGIEKDDIPLPKSRSSAPAKSRVDSYSAATARPSENRPSLDTILNAWRWSQ